MKAEVDDGTLWSTLRDRARAGAAASSAQRLGDGQLKVPLALATADGKAVASSATTRAAARPVGARPQRPRPLDPPPAEGGVARRDVGGVVRPLAALTGAAPEPQALAKAFDAFADRCVRCADVELKAEVKAEVEAGAEMEVKAEAEAEAVEELAAEMEELAVESPPPAPPPPPELDLEAEEAPEEESDDDDEVVVMEAEQPAVEAAGEAADPYDFLGPKVEKMKVPKVVPAREAAESPPPPPPPPVEEEVEVIAPPPPPPVEKKKKKKAPPAPAVRDVRYAKPLPEPVAA